MTISGLGDAAQFFRLRRDGDALTQEMGRLTRALSSGRVEDLGRATGGDFSALSDIERRFHLNTRLTEGIAQAGLLAATRQTALARLETEVSDTAPRLLAMATSGSLSDLTLTLTDMPARFDQAVQTLNASVAGVFVFSADAVDRAPLVSAEEMLDALRPLAAGAATVPDLVAAVESWFLDPGGGFETLAWQGGTGDPPKLVLGEGRFEAAGPTALDQATRAALMGLALGALAAEGTGASAATDQRALAQAAAGALQASEGALVTTRAQLGITEGRIDAARAEAEATRAALEISRSAIVAAEPYRTATELQAIEAQLETLYLLTARLSRLSLTDFLR